jgi:hypothetical protein
MTLAPAEAAQATCLDMPDAPAFGDCDGTDAASVARE